MSMYAMVFGDPNLKQRLNLAGVMLGKGSLTEFGRLRDAWFEKHPDGSLVLAVYTRNGGGNRADFEDVTRELRAHPWYRDDADDGFDSTYATYRFTVSTEAPDYLLPVLGHTTRSWPETRLAMEAQAFDEPVDTDERWKLAIESLTGKRP